MGCSLFSVTFPSADGLHSASKQESVSSKARLVLLAPRSIELSPLKGICLYVCFSVVAL